ncbi:serine hydrolase [uncultured Flavobacterium sp.]|uniref:serine hydrolase n=1 Tax=uncultured Flavobacterium sp. TaxID=165435 RepID=UPI0025D6C6B3|nr:serine hydrolase [uncultured Flavobacterium sp.]
MMKNKYFFILPFISAFGFSQTGIAVPQMNGCENKITTFLSDHDIPSATFALTKNGKLVYSRAFGHADIDESQVTQPYNMFRIASISKPITSIAIMKMAEEGQISLDDHVFGTGGLLENHWYFSSASISDTRINDITVRMLLEHTAGWDRDIDCYPDPTSPYPWAFGGCDPIIAPLYITASLGESNPVTEEHLVKFLLQKGLDHNPGTYFSYSNIGYLILSEIIEEVSGMGYEEWVKQEILHPLGIYDMHLGKTLLSEKMEREGEYVGNGYETLSLYNDGSYVPWEYGGYSLEAMDGHGGWIATARDLLRLTAAADGFATKPDILSASTIANMTEPSVVTPWYAKGWQVNTANNWWHTGALDGTASILVRTSGGYTWAVILNKRIIDSSENDFWTDLDGLGWECLATTSSYPSNDLFDSPLSPAKNLTASNVTGTGMNLNWANGDGTGRVVVMKQLTGNGQPFSAYPIDGTDYEANAMFTSAPQLPDGSRIVYSGAGNTVAVTGLANNANYAIRVYESKKSVANGNHTLYLLGSPAHLLQSTNALATDDIIANSLSVYPNPASSEITISNPNGIALIGAAIADTNGRTIFTTNDISGKECKMDVRALASGIYVLSVETLYGKFTTKVVKE